MIINVYKLTLSLTHVVFFEYTSKLMFMLNVSEAEKTVEFVLLKLTDKLNSVPDKLSKTIVSYWR